MRLLCCTTTVLKTLQYGAAFQICGVASTSTALERYHTVVTINRASLYFSRIFSKSAILQS